MPDTLWHLRSAFSSAIDLDDDLLSRDVSDTTTESAYGAVGRMTYRAAMGVLPLAPQGRLGLENDVYASTTDQTSKSTLYWNPAPEGGFMRLHNGTRWQVYVLDSPLSLSLSGITSGKNYDVWGTLSGGSPALALSSAWTNDSTRADAVARASGVLCKTGDASRILLGTIRASGSGVTESSFTTTDAPAKSFVWNLYNRLVRSASVVDSTTSWNYTSSTVRQRRGSSNNQVEFVCGETTRFSARLMSQQSWNTSGNWAYDGIGVDSTTVAGGENGLLEYQAGGFPITGTMRAGVVAAGWHYFAALEWTYSGSNTSTWYGGSTRPLTVWLEY